MLGGGVLNVAGGAADVGAGTGSARGAGAVSLWVPLVLGAVKGVETPGCLSTGFGTPSKLDVSSVESSLSSLSANFDAMLEMECWLSFIEGGGPRMMGAGAGSVTAVIAGAFLGGVTARGSSAFVGSVGLYSAGTSAAGCPSNKLSNEILGGSASLPANQSPADNPGVVPTVGG